jgi:hypothetical protein
MVCIDQSVGTMIWPLTGLNKSPPNVRDVNRHFAKHYTPEWEVASHFVSIQELLMFGGIDVLDN